MHWEKNVRSTHPKLFSEHVLFLWGRGVYLKTFIMLEFLIFTSVIFLKKLQTEIKWRQSSNISSSYIYLQSIIVKIISLKQKAIYNLTSLTHHLCSLFTLSSGTCLCTLHLHFCSERRAARIQFSTLF